MFRRLFRYVDLLVERAVAALAAAAFSQFFAFIQQYRQRLAGHLEEAKIGYRQVVENAGRYEKETHDALVNAFSERVAELQHAYDAVFEAPVLYKPVVFLANADPEIARGTLADFTPQIPLDLASLLYAALGLVLGSVLYRLLSNGLFGWRRRNDARHNGRRRSTSPRRRPH